MASRSESEDTKQLIRVFFMVTTKSKSNLLKGGPILSREDCYQKIASHATELIDYLIDVINKKEVANQTRVNACRILLNKIVPDLKVTELQGNVDKPLGVVILPTLKDEPIPTIDLSMGATSRPADSSITMS